MRWRARAQEHATALIQQTQQVIPIGVFRKHRRAGAQLSFGNPALLEGDFL